MTRGTPETTMERSKVMILLAVSASRELPSPTRELVAQPDWWERLLETDESELDDEQVRALADLGVDPQALG